MPGKILKQKSLPKVRTRTHVSTWVWAIFVSSVILFIVSAFVTTWTSAGPTFFPAEMSISKSSKN